MVALQDLPAFIKRSVEPGHEVKRFEGHPRVPGSVHPVRDHLANRYRGIVHVGVGRRVALWIGAPGAHHTPTTDTRILLGQSGEVQGGI